MSSPDEAFALRKNVVHQTRLTMELQHLEKKRSVSLRQMDKSSHVFLKKLEQMREVRRRANFPSLRAESATIPRELSAVRKEDASTHESAAEVNLPFITKSLRPEPAVPRRQVDRTKSTPALRLCHTVPETKPVTGAGSDSTGRTSDSARRARQNIGFMVRDNYKPRYPNTTHRNVPPPSAGGDGVGRVRGKGILLQRRKSDSNLMD